MDTSGTDIVGLGVVAIDEIIYVDTFPTENTKSRVRSRRRQAGGMTSCALAAAATLGSRCRMLGRLGDNASSDFARGEMHKVGIDTSQMCFVPDAHPIECTIVVTQDTGSRTVFADRGRIAPLEAHELRAEWFDGAGVLHIDHLDPVAALAAARLAKHAGLQIVSDVERICLELPALRSLIDHFICSAPFAHQYTGAEHPAEACQLLADSGEHHTVVVTAAETGCYWWSRDAREVTHQAGHVIESCDTTGCGDVFHGVFCHGLAKRWPIGQIIEWSNAAAALHAGRTGDWSHLPTAEEIDLLLHR
jgi:sugar/nucleoside kinase (ribokinase family)